MLLEAYRRNGLVDINDIRISTSDSNVTLMSGVSPLPLKDLGFRGEALLRPAALLHLFCRLSAPVLIKTHWANIQPPGLPPFIPKEFTNRAVYLVRDPRSVLESMSRYFNLSLTKALVAMGSKEFTIGGDDNFCRAMVSSWSNNVASWTGETEFPVHVIKYEDLCDDTEKEFRELLEFLEIEVDAERVKEAVKACRLSRIHGQEKDGGFRENAGGHCDFFGEGGVRWREQLGRKWITAVEDQNAEMMQAMGYGRET